MDVDTAIASAPVNKMPLIDDTDFKTIEDAVVFNQAGLALFWNFTTTAGVTTVTAVTPTSAGDYDWTDFTTSGMYGIEIPASGGASANNDTEGFGHFTGVATGILPWTGPVIGFRAAALNNALIDGGDVLDVNLTEIGGVAQSAADLKDFADAGYDPGTNKVQGVVLVDTLTTYTSNTPQTGDSFARIGAAGAGLTNINLPNQTMDIIGNITGNLSGSVGSVTGAVGSVTAAVTVGTMNANVIDAASIAASALDNKGNWNVGKTGYSLTQSFPTNFADMSITVTTGLMDITQAAADKAWATTARVLTAPTNLTSDDSNIARESVTADTNTVVTTTNISVDKIPKSDGTVTWNATALASIESEANDALVAIKLDHLVAVAESDDPVDNSIIAKMVSKEATANWSGFVNTTDSLEAIRDRGDAEWITATSVAVTSIGANVITAASIAASALDNKGNWNVGKTGYSLTQTFPTNFSSMVISAGGITDANAQQINSVDVIGAGIAADLWRA